MAVQKSSDWEQPNLWLGAAGFSPEQRHALEDALAGSGPGRPRWKLGSFPESDAWLVHGSKTRLLPDGNLKVSPGQPTERSVSLSLPDVDRPVAFSRPLPADFEPQCAFDLESSASIQASLYQFESWLKMLRAQFVIGAKIVAGDPTMRHHVFHLSKDSTLLAVLDFEEFKVAISPVAHPVDIWEAEWNQRPLGAAMPPDRFLGFPMTEVIWTYCSRTDHDLLPPLYRHRTIYFRHAPRVAPRRLNDRQLLILRELLAEPADFEALIQRTSLARDTAAHELACLYYVGSITTTRSKATIAHQFANAGPDEHSVGPPMDSMPYSHSVISRDDLTAPADLHGWPVPRPPEDPER
ncbi:MAG TPA: hypothetical protein VK996_07240 [Ramlibacter sp.]|nr:hypothetical protein [Ramlibacter sp.]